MVWSFRVCNCHQSLLGPPKDGAICKERGTPWSDKKSTQASVVNLKDVDHLDDLEVDGKIILKLFLNKKDWNMWIGFVLLRIRTSGGLTRCTTASFSRTRNALRRQIMNVITYLTFRHRASSIWDRRFATPQRTLFVYLINKYISLSDICLTVHHWYNAPEDGQNYCPKHVELTGIINKPLLLHLVGCLYYLYFIIFFETCWTVST
jgi:hypothetical protein